MNTFQVTYTDGTGYLTSANGTAEEFKAYLMQYGGIVTDENPVTGEGTRREIETVEQLLKDEKETKMTDPNTTTTEEKDETILTDEERAQIEEDLKNAG